jgi:hypothetical protein
MPKDVLRLFAACVHAVFPAVTAATVTADVLFHFGNELGRVYAALLLNQWRQGPTASLRQPI